VVVKLLDHPSEEIVGGGEGIVLRVSPPNMPPFSPAYVSFSGIRPGERRRTAIPDRAHSIHEILTNCGTLTALTTTQIDGLCERINAKTAGKSVTSRWRNPS